MKRNLRLDTYRNLNDFLKNETEKFIHNRDCYGYKFVDDLKNTSPDTIFSVHNKANVHTTSCSGYASVLRHLILCEHACYGDVYQSQIMVRLGDDIDAVHWSYHIDMKEANYNKQVSKVAFVAVMKSATVMMMAIDDLRRSKLNRVLRVSSMQYDQIVSMYVSYITDVNNKIILLANVIDVDPLVVASETTAMIQSFQARVASLVLPCVADSTYEQQIDFIKALIENVNIDFETASTFQHQKIVHRDSTVSIVTTAQGYIGGVSKCQVKMIRSMFSILDDCLSRYLSDDSFACLSSPEIFENYLKQISGDLGADMALAVAVLQDMSHAQRIIFYDSMSNDRRRNRIESGNCIVNAQKKGFSIRNPSEIIVLETKSYKLNDHSDGVEETQVVCSFSSQAAMVGPTSQACLAQNIEMHGLNHSNGKPKFFINLRFHASPPPGYLAFVRNRIINAALNIMAIPLMTTFAFVWVGLRAIKCRGNPFVKDEVFVEMSNYRKQYYLFVSEKDVYARANVRLAIGTIALGADKKLTEMALHVEVSQISQVFEDIANYVNSNSSKLKELSKQRRHFNAQYHLYKGLLKKGVVIYQERMELILRIAALVEASRAFVDIGMSSGCAQNKDRGPAGHMRAAQIAYVEMFLNKDNHENGVRFDVSNADHLVIAREVEELFAKACMRPGGDVNGASPGCTGNKAVITLEGFIPAFRLNAGANKIIENIKGG